MIMKTSLSRMRIPFGIIFQCVVTLALITWSAESAQKNTPGMIQYISPIHGSSNNSQQTNIILRLESPFPHGTTFDPSAFDVEGSVSGQHSGKIVLSDDDRTVLFNSQTSFTPDERVSVTVAPSIYDRSGKSTGAWNFDFEISHLSARDQDRVLQNRPQNDLVGNQPVAPGGSSFTAGLLAKSNSTVPSDLPRPKILVSDNPSDGAIYFSSWKVTLGPNTLVLIPLLQEYLMIVDNAGNPVYY